MQQKTRWMAICLAAGLCAGVAGATTITGTDYHIWEITAGSKMDVNDLPTQSPWTTTEGFGFRTPNDNVNVSNMPNFGSYSSGLTTSDGEIDVAAPAGGETAMLLNLGVWNGSNEVLGGGTVDVKLLDGNTVVKTLSSLPSGNFWFSSSASITSVAVLSSTAGDEPFIHALSYGISSLPPDTGGGPGNTSPIPEPATFLLVAAGGLIFFGARRRWFHHQA